MFYRLGDMNVNDKLVVLFSGGQDSTTCLLKALSMWKPEHIYPLAFDYGQRHAVELGCATAIVAELGLMERFQVLRAEALAELRAAALTSADIPVSTDATGTGNLHAEEHGLPSTFVPGRNMLFLTLGAAFGALHGATGIMTGVCQADRAGYPDCRGEFVEAAEVALRAALDEPNLTIYAPLLHRSKAETWKLAEELDAVQFIIERTNTCYHGDRETFNEWGYGCGRCGACRERALGWDEFAGTF